MKTPKVSLLSRLLLVTSLLFSLLLSSPVAALNRVKMKDSPDKLASAGRQSTVSAANPLTIPEVPVGTGSPKVNGDCSQAEYTGGLFVTFTDGPDGKGKGSVYLIHDANSLYMCITSPIGTNSTRFDSLYLDPQGDGDTYTFARQDDFSLRLDYAGGKTTLRGNGLIGGWQDSSADNSLWSGTAATGNADVAEYALPLKNFGLNICTTIFGLAGYHPHFADSSDDYGWPSNQYYDQPGTWQPVVLGSSTCSQAGSIAYVYRNDGSVAASFYNLLISAGYTVTLVPLSAVTTTDFNQFDLTIIADDTGLLNEWGNPPAATTGAAQVAQIILPNKPILGLGEGGYAFFGRLSLFIGWPMGWHGPQNILTRAAGFPPAIFSGVGPDPLQYYTSPSNSVGIYLRPDTPLPADVTPVAMENPLDDHSSLIQQGCRMLWGNGGGPTGMTASPDGKLLFLNTVGYTRGLACPKAPPTPQTCGYTVEKTALPAPGSSVTPGAIIAYTLTYQLPIKPGSVCPADGKLVDVVPLGTVFVPGSASDGISPGADGVLTWTVGASTDVQTKTFKVQVTDTACTANNIISNVAELRPSAAAPLVSTPATTHTVSCPPFGLPNTQPVFAEDELKVEPYPLVAGVPTHLSVRVHNLSTSSLPVTVQFQVAPAATPLGTGLAYTTVASTGATMPGLGTAVLAADYVPDSSGNRCFQALVSTPGLAPVVTQSCLDLTEDFKPGQSDQLVIVVRNNTASAQTYQLVVDNTCPGWSAVVDTPTITSLAPGASQEVTLTVTPPDPLTLGSGCHIDVQVWNGETLVGGVRKLDMPPIHLPLNVIPVYEEQEITFNPDPPIAGVPGQICIQLQNPLSVPKVVTVNFSVADFGAGIDFTPVASLTGITLPPHSLSTYCADWTPASGGTLHRCVLAILVQDGAMDQHSQHNVDIIHPTSSNLSSLVIPFVVGNPGPAAANLSFDINLVGINPQWSPTILTPAGDPPPGQLPGGGQVALVLRFSLGSSGLSALASPPPAYSFGSRSSVEVTELLDGAPESGFSVYLEMISHIYLPLIMK